MYYEKLLTELIGKIELSDNMQGFPSRFSLKNKENSCWGIIIRCRKDMRRRRKSK
ncbi:MAG: hypothetical protein ACLS61_15880 [Ruminococcus sp.]